MGAEIMDEYFKIGEERIAQAENGQLRIRPMDRPVYNPNKPHKYTPPQTINIDHTPNMEQPRLFEKKSNDYQANEENEEK